MSMDEGTDPSARVMFTYWGRRGALSQIALEVGRTALVSERLAATISVSRQNDNFAAFEQLGGALFPIDTFRSNAGALLQSWRIPLLRRALYARVCRERIQAVIELMPHVWSSWVMPAARLAGATYCTVIHDADRHPGDPTGLVKELLDRSIRSADVVLTLSAAVAARLSSFDRVASDRLFTLFHPDLTYRAPQAPAPPEPGEPLRLLFFGRIMPYKGLSLFLDAVDLLRQEGIAVQIGVFGEGSLGANAKRLGRMQAEVVNRWLSEAEIADLLVRYHAMVLSHTEASQSGVIATAFGAGLPVIATPVGGLIEQVRDGVTGVVARRTDAMALAEAVKRLLLDRNFYHVTCANISRLSEERSMARFVRDIVRCALRSGRHKQ